MTPQADPAADSNAPVGWRRWLVTGPGRALAVIIPVTFAAAILLPDAASPLRGIRFWAFDTYQVWFAREQRSAPAVIVHVDDHSLLRVGQWPWPRDIVARLIDRIAARAPAAIALDIVFSEPDRSSPERIAEWLRPRDRMVAERLLQMRRNDDILAEAIRRSRAVLGVAGVEEPVTQGSPPAPARVIGPDVPLHRYVGALRSLPALDQAASGHGLLNADPERGIVRRMPLVAKLGTDPVLTLALESFRVAARLPSFNLIHGGGLTQVEVGDLQVLAQRDGKAWLHFSPHDPRRFISAADVLAGNDDPARIEGKIVLVGVSALALEDQHTTARGERMPGVEIHAQLVENIFDGTLLRRPAWAPWVEMAAFLMAFVALVMLVPQSRERRSIFVLLACGVILLAAGSAAFYWGHLLFDWAAPLVGAAIVYMLMVLNTLVAADLRRRELSASLAAQREGAARVTGELEAGRRIQMGMLPTRESALRQEPRIEIFPYMKAAREVGGDLYDFFPVPGDKFVVLIGDVSGKGLPAAMFMAVSKALAKSCALRATEGPAALMTTLNQEISRENPAQNFVTLAAMMIDLRSGETHYCNAGHEPPILVRRSGETVFLDEGGGPPLCVIDNYDYEEARVRLEPRDVLALTSDGLTEAMNRGGALYGRARLKALLESPARRGLDLTILGSEILAGIKTFEAGAEPADDQTLVLVAWRGG